MMERPKRDYLPTKDWLESYHKLKQYSEQLEAYCDQLESDKVELIEGYRELLIDAKNMYEAYYPNNFRKTADEYYADDEQLLSRMETP